ncbi:unnamed protein product [Effrenium voratum]|nr:unnamed protein product [Effrenium voratum]
MTWLTVAAADVPEDEEEVAVEATEAEKRAEEDGNNPDAYAAAAKESADAVQGIQITEGDKKDEEALAKLKEYQEMVKKDPEAALDKFGGNFVEEWVEERSVKDPVFARFQRFHAANKNHVLRYQLGGEPRWFCQFRRLEEVPACPRCGAARVFECQVQPMLISLIKGPLHERLDFGIICIYTCEESCDADIKSPYVEELVYVQAEPSEWLPFSTRQNAFACRGIWMTLERWICVCPVALTLGTAPRGKGELVAHVRKGEAVVFTAFPKRNVEPKDLERKDAYLRCRKVEGQETSQQGWILCNSEHGVHFVSSNECAESDDLEPEVSHPPLPLRVQPCGFRSGAQDAWLGSLPRLQLPSDVSGARRLLSGNVRGKFRGLVVCDALSGPSMGARPCLDHVAGAWLRENFQEEVQICSSVDLAGLLERRSVEDRHRLVLLLVQEPRAWLCRALLGGLQGAFLAASRPNLEFASIEEAKSLESWLKQPVECMGNVHMKGLMSLWAWYVQDLAKAAAAPNNRHVCLCRAEDLLFNSLQLREALKLLGLRAREELSAPVTRWWRQGIECYRQSSRLTLEEAKAMDDPVASLRATLGYDGARDWLRWAQLAEDQVAELTARYEKGLVGDEDLEEVRLDPQDRRRYTLEELCSKHGTSRGEAVQYFWSHSWPLPTAPSRDFAFDGLWTYSSGTAALGAGAIRWQNGSVTAIYPTSDVAFNMELEGETFQGRLVGDRLVFSDGDLWIRVASREEPAPPAPEPEAPPELPPEAEDLEAVPAPPNSTPEAELEPEVSWKDHLLQAVAEVLFRAVAKQQVDRVLHGLQQISLMSDGVQRLLATRDEQENSLLHLAVREAAGGSDASLAVVTALLDARADVHACDGQGRPAMELAEPSKSLRHILLEAAATQAASAASPMDAAPLRLRVPVKGIPAASPAPEEEEPGDAGLTGVRVADACGLGPFSAGALASQGAEVLRLELREGVEEEQLQDILRCQVLIHNFRAATAERLGLGKALRTQQEHLLVISISGCQKTSAPTLDAIVSDGNSAPSMQRITAQVAAGIICRALRNLRGDSSDMYKKPVEGVKLWIVQGTPLVDMSKDSTFSANVSWLMQEALGSSGRAEGQFEFCSDRRIEKECQRLGFDSEDIQVARLTRDDLQHLKAIGVAGKRSVMMACVIALYRDPGRHTMNHKSFWQALQDYELDKPFERLMDSAGDDQEAWNSWNSYGSYGGYGKNGGKNHRGDYEDRPTGVFADESLVGTVFERGDA